jgi:hypothetical protein
VRVSVLVVIELVLSFVEHRRDEVEDTRQLVSDSPRPV